MGKFDNVRTDAITILASAARTSNPAVVDQNNDAARGVLVVLDTTAVTAAVNEVQNVLVDATGGTYTLTFSGQTTSALAYNADSAAIETALRALSSIGGTNVSVAPGDAGSKNVTFQSALAGTNVPVMTANPASLTGGTSTVTITTTTEGVPASSITLSIRAKDTLSGKTITLLTGAAVVSTGTTAYRVYPGLTAVTNATVSDALPKTWNVNVNHNSASPCTYSVAAYLLA